MNAMRRHFDGEADKYEVEYRILTNAGEYKWFYDSGSIVKRDIHKIPIVVAGLVIDITARKQTELQIQLQNEDLQKLNATKDKFFSIISHDLRSPFNGILGFSTILVDQIEEKNFDGIEEYARIVKNSAQRALSLLMNLLEWSRSQTGLVKFSPEYVEIGILIDEVANLFVEMAQQKSIELSIELPSKVIAFGDKDMLGCILRNLISNALKFTNPGGHIVISAERKPDEILFSVSDNGVGMKKEALGKIFRIDSSSSTKGTNDEKGTGLGLILCKEFVEKHRGKIWAESELGKGSEFKFSIPVKDIGIPQFYADSLS
jgi:signal transduction histidine kinase